MSDYINIEGRCRFRSKRHRYRRDRLLVSGNFLLKGLRFNERNTRGRRWPSVRSVWVLEHDPLTVTFALALGLCTVRTCWPLFATLNASSATS